MAQEEGMKKSFEIYGYVKTDIGFNFNQMDPNWFDILRVSKLPQYKDQYAPDGKIYFSVRETRLGINSWMPTPLGQLKFNFEFDLFGVGQNVGQTAFHFRKANVELGRFAIGQNQSLFTDVDVSPTSLDNGAPPSRPFLRSIQVRYMQTKQKYRWGLALEQPGATSDEGIYAERIELQSVRQDFKVPDLTAQYRRMLKGGYIEAGGVAKWIKWKNTVPSAIDLSGDEMGWGLYLSSTQRLTSRLLFKSQLVYGRGMENYLTDGGPDIGIKNNTGSTTKPVLGVALPVMGALAFLEHNWSSKWSSTIGYSGIRIYNSDAQAGNAFKNGRYGIFNLLHQPFPQCLTGVELQWGKRNNFSDGFSSSIVKIQCSFKYSFSHLVGEEVTSVALTIK